MLGGESKPASHASYMTEGQMADYLRDLRKGRQERQERPAGSRPPPPSRLTGSKRGGTTPVVTPVSTNECPPLQTTASVSPLRSSQAMSSNRNSLPANISPFAGHPLVRPPSGETSGTRSASSTSSESQPAIKKRNSAYMERGTRWMEKQEAQSIRAAMEHMDLEEEKKIHAGAQDEAAELVWRHQNPNVPYANPDLVGDSKRDFRFHLRKGSYRRSVSRDAAPPALRGEDIQAVRATSEDTDNVSKETPTNLPLTQSANPPVVGISIPKTRKPSGPSYDGLAEAVASDVARAQRRTSSGGRRIFSTEKKMYMDPNDRIWEDPQEEATPPRKRVDAVAKAEEPIKPAQVSAALPSYVRKNPFARVRMQAEKLERSQSDSIISPGRNSLGLEKPQGERPQNPWYVSNVTLPPPTATNQRPSPEPERATEVVSSKRQSVKDGMEIRSDEIRAATSKSRKDYSPKLPRPTVVSDKPGRPIVSFKEDWKPREVFMEEIQAPAARTSLGDASRISNTPDAVLGNAAGQAPHRRESRPHQTCANPPQIPIINLPSESPKAPIPTINVPDEAPAIPTIVFPGCPEDEPEQLGSTVSHANNVSIQSINIPGQEQSPPSRAVQDSRRPSPRHSATVPIVKSSPHYTPTVRRSGVLCAHCAVPIAGRILSADGERFHPSCFNCHECNTNLELVAFYPEPEAKRNERIDRINARILGHEVPLPEGITEDEARRFEATDGIDDSPRFYCHLDFHELFSPRCKSCKTPIEGEVVVACGAEWHVGHFFCAQCGDPFESSTPFVEKDGYAWCVGCHTNRYSSKCRRCRKPIIDTVAKALGAEWHVKCFVCVECNAEFADGRFFVRGDSQDPVCVACEERRLKA